mgnify:CR=1 FL=1
MFCRTHKVKHLAGVSVDAETHFLCAVVSAPPERSSGPTPSASLTQTTSTRLWDNTETKTGVYTAGTGSTAMQIPRHTHVGTQWSNIFNIPPNLPGTLASSKRHSAQKLSRFTSHLSYIRNISTVVSKRQEALWRVEAKPFSALLSQVGSSPTSKRTSCPMMRTANRI